VHVPGLRLAPLQGWQAIVKGAEDPQSVACVAAQCMLVMQLTRVLPEWNNWLAYDVLFIRWVGSWAGIGRLQCFGLQGGCLPACLPACAPMVVSLVVHQPANT